MDDDQEGIDYVVSRVRQAVRGLGDECRENSQIEVESIIGYNAFSRHTMRYAEQEWKAGDRVNRPVERDLGNISRTRFQEGFALCFAVEAPS